MNSLMQGKEDKVPTKKRQWGYISKQIVVKDVFGDLSQNKSL